MAGTSRWLDDEAQERRRTSDLMRMVESAAVRNSLKDITLRPMRLEGIHMTGSSRRSFLKATAALAGVSPLTVLVRTASAQPTNPLLAYVGTFSSPLRDTLPTQVDLPPGNG